MSVSLDEIRQVIRKEIQSHNQDERESPAHTLQKEIQQAIHREIESHNEEKRELREKTREHPIYDFMQSCPNCGQTNAEYKRTRYRCTKCQVPVVPERVDSCWNCGNSEAEEIEEEEQDE